MKYTFNTSQPLTDEQLGYLNKCLENLPSQDDDSLDIPEWFTELIEEE